MNIFVIMKRTFDTEEKINIQAGKVSEDGATFIINPYDEYAIEEALKLREEHGGRSSSFTLKKLECLKQACAMNTLAWNNNLGLRSYFVGFWE